MALETSRTLTGDSLIDAVADWLIAQSLGTTQADKLLEQCALRLNGAGIPLWRATLGFQILHPLYDAINLTWYRDSGLEDPNLVREGRIATDEIWLHSPLAHLIENNIPHLRRRLTGPDGQIDFPILEDIRERGGTDYFAYLVSFGSPEDGPNQAGGVAGSWATDRAGGFNDGDIRALMRIQQRLALACKMTIKEQITRNVLSAYLGPDAGEQVMDGQIKLGDGQEIHAVIWFSDLRQSTKLADELTPQAFIETINGYFDCTAGAVLAHSGQVLRFVGDAVLAIFPIRADGLSEQAACEHALAAAADSETRMAALNTERAELGHDPLNFGLGLHLGDVMYGNIGVPERVEFSVIGPAANEAARLEDLTKTLGHPILVSETFANALEAEWKSLGLHQLRGVGEPMEVFARVATDTVEAAE